MTTPDLNPITGLPDGYNEALGIPIINHRNIGRLRLSRQRVAENHIQMGRRRVLAFASKLQRSEVLVVTFHGANMRNKEIIYPRYERFATFCSVPASVMCFADPTIQFTPKVLLAWYLGDESYDPLDYIERAVQNAMSRVGATDVVFVGGSGGGHPALRCALRFPGSTAFVQSPRVNLEGAIPTAWNRFIDQFWSGWTLKRLIAEFPERFDLVTQLREKYDGQRIYYLQGVWDHGFLWRDYRLAKRALGLEAAYGSTKDGRVVFELFDGLQNDGDKLHGPPPRPIFNHHWNTAMRRFGLRAEFPQI